MTLGVDVVTICTMGLFWDTVAYCIRGLTGNAPVSYWPICFPSSLYHSQKSLRKLARPSFLLEFTRVRAKLDHNSSPQNKPMVQFDRTATQASRKFKMA